MRFLRQVKEEDLDLGTLEENSANDSVTENRKLTSTTTNINIGTCIISDGRCIRDVKVELQEEDFSRNDVFWRPEMYLYKPGRNSENV